MPVGLVMCLYGLAEPIKMWMMAMLILLGSIPPRWQVLTAAQNGIEKYEFVLVLLNAILVGFLRGLIIVLWTELDVDVVFINSRAEEIGLYLFQIRSLHASLGKASVRRGERVKPSLLLLKMLLQSPGPSQNRALGLSCLAPSQSQAN